MAGDSLGDGERIVFGTDTIASSPGRSTGSSPGRGNHFTVVFTHPSVAGAI